jgi:hypothetical protein
MTMRVTHPLSKISEPFDTQQIVNNDYRYAPRVTSALEV